MNWAGLSVTLGLLWVASMAGPWGLLIVAGLAWAWLKG